MLSGVFLMPDLAIRDSRNPTRPQLPVIGLPTSCSVADVLTQGPFVSGCRAVNAEDGNVLTYVLQYTNTSQGYLQESTNLAPLKPTDVLTAQ